MKFKNLLFLLIISYAGVLYSQQKPDTTFNFTMEKPSHTTYNPIIGIDEMHNNFHTKDGGFAPFTKLAEKDGYKVVKFSDYSQLENIDILVVANPINSKNQGNWTKPIYPAFVEDEIEKIKNWVSRGGSLILIADHMPFAGAANSLANSFGFDYCDGFAKLNSSSNRDIFSKENGRLKIPETFSNNQLNDIISFTGSAFKYPEKSTPILSFHEKDTCLIPKTAWQFNQDTKKVSLPDYAQGAIMPFGKGRLAVFGEAAMFTAQEVTQNGNTFKIGFNSPFAQNNIPFIRQILLWASPNQFSLKSKLKDSEEAIIKTMREMEQTFNKGDFKDVAGYYSKDAKMIGNRVYIEGEKELNDYWSQFTGDLKWKLESNSFSNMGENHVLQNGYSNIYFPDENGEIKTSRSFFTLIWEKIDNAWKIKLDHFSPTTN